MRFFAIAAIVGFGMMGGAARAQKRDESYPYSGKTFARFVGNSYRGESGNAKQFFDWMSAALEKSPDLFPGESGRDLSARMAGERKRILAISDAGAKSNAEIQTAEKLHKTIKTILPKFSLERGYEFRYAVERGERQCLLQSVIMAGMLQQMGMNAGAFMVWKSESGNESNNGHVVTILKLADGRDVLVDCSDPHPIAKQQGLFVWNSAAKRYQFVQPVYNEAGFINGYQAVGTETTLPNKSVRPLDVPFLDSQFDYYRGEHTLGGLVHRPSTPTGLAQEMRYLRRAVRLSPQNPLALYMLGRVYMKQNKMGAAQFCLTRAYALYEKAGRVPQGVRDARKELAVATRKPTVKRA